jgi:nucleoside-diphosphate-sugar epimerase
MTVVDFARRIIAACGSRSEIVYKPLPEDDPKVRQPDISQARSRLAWEPAVPLDKGLESTIEYFRSLLAKGAI